MKILHLITTIEVGGAEKHLLQLATAQSKLGHEVRVMYLKGMPQLKRLFEEQKIEVVTHRWENFVGVFFLFVRTLSNFKPKVVHVHLPRAELYARIANLLIDFDYVISRHNSEPLFFRKSSQLNRTLTKFVGKTATGVIYISESAKKAFTLRNEMLVNENNTVIYYGLDIKSKTIVKTDLSNFKTKRCFTLSRLTRQKNLELLIDVFSELKDWDFVFDIYGEGELKKILQKKICKYGLEDKVRLMGKKTEIETIFVDYEYFILASLYEGFGLAVLEAMNHDKYVIASGTSSILEILGEEYEFLFDPTSKNSVKNTIIRAWNEADTATLGYIEKRRKLFAEEDMVSRTLQFYDSVKAV